MTFPQSRPAAGLCMPCKFEKARDGDTIVVRCMVTDTLLALRLVDTWCPELRNAGGREAMEYAVKLILPFRDILMYSIPFDREDIIERRENGGKINVLKMFTFDRVPAYLWLHQNVTLNEEMVNANFASTTKKGRLGE